MGHKWIIDVLADLQSFARQNDLPLLAGQLHDAALVAEAEVASMIEGAPVVVRGDGAERRSLLAEAGAGRRV